MLHKHILFRNGLRVEDYCLLLLMKLLARLSDLGMLLPAQAEMGHRRAGSLGMAMRYALVKIADVADLLEIFCYSSGKQRRPSFVVSRNLSKITIEK